MIRFLGHFCYLIITHLTSNTQCCCIILTVIMGKKLSGLSKKSLSVIRNNPFPAVVIGLFLLLTVLGISGSSMGSFDRFVLGDTPGVIAGTARTVRSDEWLWQSQSTLIQKQDGFPAVNDRIGLGEDMTMVLDVPFRNVYTIFKPQNLSFFILPLNMAFAAKWWFIAMVLMLGFYFLMDTLFPGKRLIIALGAVLLLFNPYVQWWYQSITLLSIGWALWAAYFSIKLFSDKTSTKKLALHGLGLAYVIVCFILLLYPPFQIPVAYVAGSLVAGYLYYRYFVQKKSLKADGLRWLAFAAALVLAAGISGIFYESHKQVIHTIKDTAYPGVRNVKSGEYSGVKDGEGINMQTTFSAPTLYKLQKTGDAGHYPQNQSEASRIVVLNLLLLPFIVVYIFQKPRAQRKLADYLLLSTGVVGLLFSVRLFTPFFNLPYKLLLFSQVENERLPIGFAALCAVQLVLIGVLAFQKRSIKSLVAIALVVFAICFDASMMVADKYPGFIGHLGVLAVSAAVALAAFLILHRRYFAIGLGLFVAFNLASSLFVNPLYDRGEPKSLQSMADAISSHYKDDKNWVMADDFALENVPLVAGEHSLSGIQVYPQLKLWEKLDPTHKDIVAYNRYAHVTFHTIGMPDGATFFNPGPDALWVRLDCTTAKKLPDLGYVLTSSKIGDPGLLKCMKLDRSIKYPKTSLFVYKYSPA